MPLTMKGWQGEQRMIRREDEQRRAARRAYAQFSNPKAVAHRAKFLTRAFPSASADLVTSLAVSGIDPESDQFKDLMKMETRRQAGRGNFLQPGETTNSDVLSEALLKSPAAPPVPKALRGPQSKDQKVVSEWLMVNRGLEGEPDDGRINLSFGGGDHTTIYDNNAPRNVQRAFERLQDSKWREKGKWQGAGEQEAVETYRRYVREEGNIDSEEIIKRGKSLNLTQSGIPKSVVDAYTVLAPQQMRYAEDIYGGDPASDFLSEVIMPAPGAWAKAGGKLAQAGADVTGLGELPGVPEAIRGVSRATFLALDTPMQLVNAEIRNFATDVNDIFEYGDLYGGPFQGAVGAHPTLEQTQGGQALKQLIEGDPVDVGSGWFPDLESSTAKRAALESKQAGPRLYGGHAFTPGRFIANTVFNPNTTEFNILSGAVDATVTLKADPMNLAASAVLMGTRQARVLQGANAAQGVALAPGYKRLYYGTNQEQAERIAAEGFNPGRRRPVNLTEDLSHAQMNARKLSPKGSDGTIVEVHMPTRDLAQGRGTRTSFNYDEINEQAKHMGIYSASDQYSMARTQQRYARTDVRTAEKELKKARAAAEQADADVMMTHGFGDVNKSRRQTEAAEAVAAAEARVDEAHEAYGGAKALRHETRWRAIEEAGGYGEGIRPWLRQQTTTNWFASKQGADVIDYHVANDNIADSLERYGGQGGVEFHKRMADATTRDEVMDVFDEFLGTTLRESPVAKRFQPNWKPRLDGYRWAQMTPNEHALKPDDTDGSIVTADRWMRNAQLSRAERHEIINRIARASEQNDWHDATERMAEMVEGKLMLEFGITAETAREITTLQGMRVPKEVTAFGVAATTGKNIDNPLAVIGDGGVVMPSAMLDVEQQATSIPLPDYADIRKLTRDWGGFSERMRGRAAKLAEDATLSSEHKAMLNKIADAKDWQETWLGYRAIAPALGFWRKMRLFRPAWGLRVIAEEQARIWQYGLIGVYSHPITAMAIIAGVAPDGKLAGTLNKFADAWDHVPLVGVRVGETFRPRFTATAMAQKGKDQGLIAFDETEQWAESLNENLSTIIDSSKASGLARKARHHVKGWTVAERLDTKRWSEGVRDEIVRLRRSTIARGVAQADSPEDATQWLLHGDGRTAFDKVFRPDRVVRINPTAAPKMVKDLTPKELEQAAAWYVETVMSRIQGVSANDSRILAAIREGQLNGKKVMGQGKGYNELLDEITSMAESGWHGPDHVRTPLFIDMGEAAGPQGTGWVDKIMWNLMPRPSNYLSRSPVFRQLYWQRMAEMTAFMDPKAKAKLIRNMEGANVTDDVARMIRSTAADANGITLRQADEVAKAYSLQGVKGMLYDLSEKHQFWDQLGLLFPFGEAFQEVLQRWARAAWENPMVLRRLGQGIQEGRQAGFFHKGPFGQEVFTMPGAEWISEKLIGVPVPIEQSVGGLSIMGNGLPGVGPVVQIPAAYLLAEKPSTKFVREFIFPFGEGGYGGGAAESIASFALPQWAQHAAKFLDTAEGDRQFGTTVGMMMNYLASTGKYKVWGKDAAAEGERMLDDATSAAKWFSILRGAFSSTMPTAPIPRWSVRDSKNKLVEANILREKYYDRLTKNGEDSAFNWLVRNFGTKNFLIAQGMTTTSSALPRTEEQWDWVAENGWARDLYPSIYGLLAPPDPKGDFDITGYQMTEEARERERLTPRRRLALANHRLGSWVYDQIAQAAGPDPNDEQEDILAQLNEKLMREFPGYKTEPVDFAATQRRIMELERAVKDPKVQDARPEVVNSVRAYLDIRDEVLNIQDDRNLTRSSVSSAESATDLREILRRSARTIYQAYPDFLPIWRSVFRREAREPGGD